MSQARIILEYRYTDQPTKKTSLASFVTSEITAMFSHDEADRLSIFLGRLVEALALGGVNFKDPGRLNELLYGYNTGYITKVSVLAPEDNDDTIPF